LPDPKSCLITGIGPEQCLRDGLLEYQFFSQINAAMLIPGTCSAGFNSIRFDDEFIRYGLYRNLFDPYQREYRDGNSRWDLLDVLRAAADLRPEGLQWPRDAEGKPSFRLEALTAANGIEHRDAHDALADVKATIEMARLLRQAQPRFFDWAWKHRTKDSVRRLVDIHKRLPFVHSSGMFSSSLGSTTLVAPIVPMPGNPNCILCYDLRFDPMDLLNLDPLEIRERIFTKNEDLQARGFQRIHIKGVHLNRSPFVAPVKILEEGDTAQRLGIDLDLCRANWQKLQAEPALMQKLIQVYAKADSDRQDRDADFSLYAGFIDDHDRTYLEAIHFEAGLNRPLADTTAAILELNQRLHFDNPKLTEMVRRFTFRNWPESLENQESARWRSFCASRLLMPPGDRIVTLDFYKRKIAEHMADTNLPAPAKKVLGDLATWGKRLERDILAWRPPDK